MPRSCPVPKRAKEGDVGGKGVMVQGTRGWLMGRSRQGLKLKTDRVSFDLVPFRAFDWTIHRPSQLLRAVICCHFFDVSVPAGPAAMAAEAD